MQAMFDRLQAELADAIDPSTNTVGHFVKQIYHFAEGGLASGTENADMGFAQKIIAAGQKTIGADDASKQGGKYGESPLGQGFYNSAPYIAQHYSQLGKFFNASTPQSERITPPQKGQPAQATDPDVFYSRWANKMREFSEASAIAERGQQQIRTK